MAEKIFIFICHNLEVDFFVNPSFSYTMIFDETSCSVCFAFRRFSFHFSIPGQVSQLQKILVQEYFPFVCIRKQMFSNIFIDPKTFLNIFNPRLGQSVAVDIGEQILSNVQYLNECHYFSAHIKKNYHKYSLLFVKYFRFQQMLDRIEHRQFHAVVSFSQLQERDLFLSSPTSSLRAIEAGNLSQPKSDLSHQRSEGGHLANVLLKTDNLEHFKHVKLVHRRQPQLVVRFYCHCNRHEQIKCWMKLEQIQTWTFISLEGLSWSHLVSQAQPKILFKR